MKVWIFFGFLLCLGGGVFAQDLKVTFGGGLGYLRTEQWVRISDSSGDASFTQDITNLGGIELWLDTTFLTLRGGYFTGLLPLTRNSVGVEIIDQGTQEVESTTRIVTWGLWGKYPLSWANFTLAPGLGFLYSKNLEYKRPPSPPSVPDLWTEELWELNDLFLQTGIELDWRLNTSLVVRLIGTWGLNVNTHRQGAKNYAQNLDLDMTHGGSLLTATLGLGYTL